jgi:hypothetical protein
VATDDDRKRSVPIALIERYAVRSGKDVFPLRVEADEAVLLRNWKRVAPLRTKVRSARLVGDTLAFQLGKQAAEDYASASPETLFAALIVAAATGHPDETAGALRDVWSPHLAAASGTHPKQARTLTKIRRFSRYLSDFFERGVELVPRAASYTAFLDRDRKRNATDPRKSRGGKRRQLRVDTAGAAPEGYEYWVPERQIEAQQRELALTARFAAYLGSLGRKITREAIPTGAGEIIYDLYDTSERILFEAKADAQSRPQLRMAIRPAVGLLLPRVPS